MKRVISLFCAAVMLIMIVSLAACSSGQDISGTYRLVELNSGGQDMTSSLDLITITMTIDGNTAVLDSLTGSSEKVEWKVNTGKQLFSKDNGATIPYTIEGDRLILEGGEGSDYTKMVFEKTESSVDSK